MKNLKAGLCALSLCAACAGSSLLSGCSDKGPDKPVVDKSQFQAPQSSFQQRPGGGGGQPAPPGPPAR